MLNEGAEILAEPIFQIAIMSLGSEFSAGCKTANIKPIFKNGKNIELMN